MNKDKSQEFRDEFEFEEITEKEAMSFKKLLGDFVQSYKVKDSDLSDQEWLKGKFLELLPSLTKDEAEKLSEETVNSITEYDKNLSNLNESCAKGTSKEKWFADKVVEASRGVSIINYGNYLNSIDIAMANANTQMFRTVTTNTGNINQCYNLDGFIAEQHHVNKFNIRAALNKSKFRAEVCVPKPGQTYGLNSFDSVIKDIKTGKIIHQYQFKYGADAKATIDLIRKGNYNNQRIIVPVEQVNEVREAFPGKTIQAFIGGSDKVQFKSDELTKAQVKELQNDTQLTNVIPKNDWNNFTTKELALNLGKNAGVAGLQAAAITVGISMASKVFSGETMDADETIETALRSGADVGVKAAAAGALKVGVEKGIITLIPKGTPIGVIANIACVGIENTKILSKVATGDITVSQAMDQMGRTTVSMVYGLGWGSAGAGIGALALSWIPIVGPVVGGLTGGMIGYMAGSTFGSTIYAGFKKVRNTIKQTVRSAFNTVKSGFNSVKNFLFV